MEAEGHLKENLSLSVNGCFDHPFESLCKVDIVTRAPPSTVPVVPSPPQPAQMTSTRSDQLEREKRELTMQLKIKEEKAKSFLNRNQFLEETIKKLELANELKENELTKAKKDLSLLIAEKDNLSNEIRKLSRSQNASTESQSLWGQMTAASRELCRAEEQINSLNHEIIDLKTAQCSLQRQVERYQEKELQSDQSGEALDQEKEKRVIAESQLALLHQDNNDLSARVSELENALTLSQREHDEELSALRKEIARLVTPPAPAPVEVFSLPEPETLSQSALEMESSLSAVIEGLKDKLFESEKARRRLHNKLQDLKGNVRVFVRCRPFLPCDQDESGEVSCVNCNADGTTITLTEHCQRGGGQVHQFDQVYNSRKSQFDVFRDVSDFIQSALDGYRVCVFSYGQTGSGKVSSSWSSSRSSIPFLLSDSHDDW
jgi:kinesin family member C1